MSAATINADELRLVLASAKLRRYSRGRTPLLCVLSPGPVIEVDCASSSEWTRPGLIEHSRRFGRSRLAAQVMHRGHVARLYERVRREHGLVEVKRTWRSGIRALRDEPRYVLHGGLSS